MNFMQLPDEFAGEDSAVVILPVAYEKHLTFGTGASAGPDAIIEAAKHLEYYDFELESEPFINGIQLTKVLRCSNLEPEDAQDKIYQKAKPFVDENKFCIGIGGDHSVTGGFVRAQAEKHENVSVLMIDAHADMRYSWNGSQWNHACIGRRLAAKHKVAVVGVRSLDKDEHEYTKKEPNVLLVKPQDIENKIDEVISHLTGKVYLSIDVDGFDSSFIKNTGTPEPGGLTWQQVIRLIRKLFEKKEIVGADIVEFAPKDKGSHAEAFALAKLLYKIVGYKFKP